MRYGEHEDGAAYGGGTARDGNVEEQQGDGDNPYGAQGEPGRLEKNHEDACEEDNVKTADGEHVDESGPLEIVAEGFGNAAPVAGEKAQQESGLGWVEVVGKASLYPLAEVGEGPLGNPTAADNLVVVEPSVGGESLALEPAAGVERARHPRGRHRVPRCVVAQGVARIRRRHCCCILVRFYCKSGLFGKSLASPVSLSGDSRKGLACHGVPLCSRFRRRIVYEYHGLQLFACSFFRFRLARHLALCDSDAVGYISVLCLYDVSVSFGSANDRFYSPASVFGGNL